MSDESPWEEKLVLAIELNRPLDEMKSIFADVNVRGRSTWRFCADPLHCAAARGRRPVVKMLLEAEFDVNSVTESNEGDLRGATPLHFASLHGQ